MLKPLLTVTLLSALASVAIAQSASAPDPQASAPVAKKKHRLHVPRLRPGASAAVNPETSADKKGGA